MVPAAHFSVTLYLPIRATVYPLLASPLRYLKREEEGLETPLYLPSCGILRDPLPQWYPLEVLQIHLLPEKTQHTDKK